MIDLQGQKGEVTFTFRITRKETGVEESYQMVGYLDPEVLEPNPEGAKNGSDPLVSST
jgi:hypothetical protein